MRTGEDTLKPLLSRNEGAPKVLLFREEPGMGAGCCQPTGAGNKTQHCLVTDKVYFWVFLHKE